MYENITYEDILDRMLDRIPDTMDKREGSVICDALAPAAIELQLMYIELDNIINESFADTASREYLIKRAAERGIAPEPAKSARVKGNFAPNTLNIPVGSRFNLGVLNYIVTEKTESGDYMLSCETLGIVGNEIGPLIPIEEITGLETAVITEILIPGEEEEDTEIFRKRYYDSFDMQAFGGNIADYKYKVNALTGVGECKVYPVWNGGGTVKLVILDSTYAKPSDTLVKKVQTAIDPEINKGIGRGLAPIGHTVTVVAVTGVKINVASNIIFEDGNTLETAIESLRNAIEKYLLTLRKSWGDTEHIVARISQIESALLDCVEVIDVSGTSINGREQNIILESDEVPERGTVNGA